MTLDKDTVDQQQQHAHLKPHPCPTCGGQSGFDFLGEQRWPERLVEKMGVGPVVTLWRCRDCDTTITVDT